MVPLDSVKAKVDTAAGDTLMEAGLRKNKVQDSMIQAPGARPVVPERELPSKEEEEGAKKEIRKNNKSMKETLEKVKKEN